MDADVPHLGLADIGHLQWPAGLEYSAALEAAVVVLCGSESSDGRCRAVVVTADGAVHPIAQAADLRQPRCHPDEPLLAVIQDSALLAVSLVDGTRLPDTAGLHDIESCAWIAGSTDLVVSGSPEQGRTHGLHLLGTRSASMTQLVAGPQDCIDVAVDPHGKYIAYTAREIGVPVDVAASRLCLYDIDAGTTRQVHLPYAAISQPTWDPTGRFIATIGRPLGPAHWSANHEIVVVAANAGDSTCRRVSAPDCNAGRRVPGARTLAWHGESLFYVAPHQGCLRIWRAEHPSGRPPVPLHAGQPDGHVLDFCVAGTGSVLFWDVWLDRLATLRRLSIDSAEQAYSRSCPEVVLDPHARLSGSRAQPEVRRLRTHAPDGVPMESFAIHDRVKACTGPVLVDLHGGPHGLHPNPSLPSLVLPWLLAGLGWTVLMPNPRGSTSYGAAFQRAVVGDWAGGDAADVVALVAKHRAAPGSGGTYLMGWSYGAYLAAFLACGTVDIAGAVMGAPMTDLLRMESTTDIPEYCHHELGGRPSERATLYTARSPITHVREDMPDLLILHAIDDHRCPVDQSKSFANAVRSRDGLVTVQLVETDDHLLSTPRFRLHRIIETYTWLVARAKSHSGRCLPPVGVAPEHRGLTDRGSSASATSRWASCSA